METIYLCIVIFLFVLAVFDLVVGVSNDAVNFLQSAVGAKAASDGHRPAWHLPAGAFLFCRNHVYPAGRHADRRSAAGRIQHNGDAYIHHRIHGIRTAGRNIRPGAHQGAWQ